MQRRMTPALEVMTRLFPHQQEALAWMVRTDIVRHLCACPWQLQQVICQQRQPKSAFVHVGLNITCQHDLVLRVDPSSIACIRKIPFSQTLRLPSGALALPALRNLCCGLLTRFVRIPMFVSFATMTDAI